MEAGLLDFHGAGCGTVRRQLRKDISAALRRHTSLECFGRLHARPRRAADGYVYFRECRKQIGSSEHRDQRKHNWRWLRDAWDRRDLWIRPLEMSRDFSRPWAVPYVRDSAAVAGVPGRNTVFEYGFPEPASSVQSLPSDVFVKGALPIQFPPAASQRAPRALPDILAEVGAFDQLDMNMPPSGGLPGLIQQYLRDR